MSIKYYSRVLAITVIYTVIADLFFYQQVPGWTVGIYSLLLTIAICTRKPLHGSKNQRTALTVLLLGQVLLLLNNPTRLSVTLAVLGLISSAMTTRLGWVSDMLSWLRRWYQFLLLTFIQFVNDHRTIHRWALNHGSDQFSFRRFSKNWFIPVLFCSVFNGIFVQANPVIGIWYDNLKNYTQRLIEFFPDYIEFNRIL